MTREQYEIRKAEERRGAFLEAIAPILKHKASLYSMSMPKMTIYPDGRTETEYPQWVTDLAAEYDKIIEQVARQFAGKDESPAPYKHVPERD